MKIYISILIFLNKKFKELYDFKVENWILNYYFGFSKLIFQLINLLIESKNGHINFEYCYLNMKIDISIMKFSI
jgi:hypothetical protein